MDCTLKTQNALHRFLDCDNVEAKSRYMLLSEPERAEVLRWVDLLQTGLLAVVPGLPDPVQVDETLATNMIREVWKRSCERRQVVAAELLSGAGEHGSLDVVSEMLDAAIPAVQA